MSNSIVALARKAVGVSIAGTIAALATFTVAYFSDPKISVRDVTDAHAEQVQDDQGSFRPRNRVGMFYGLFV